MFNFCSTRFSLTCCFSFCSSQPFPFPQLPVVTEMVSFLPVKMHALALFLLLVLPGSPCFWCWVMLFHGLAWVCFVSTAFSVWSMSYHFSSVPCEHCVQLCDFPPHYLPCCASLLSTCSCASSLCMCCLSSVCAHVQASLSKCPLTSVHRACSHPWIIWAVKVPVVASWLQYQILELKPFLSYKTQFKCSFLHVLSKFIHCLMYEP